MSYRQCLWVQHTVRVEAFLEILTREYMAEPHPAEPGSFLVGDPPLPFYTPKLIGRSLAITGFNHVPLSQTLLRALDEHPELTPPGVQVRWVEEQELIVRGTIDRIGAVLGGKER